MGEITLRRVREVVGKAKTEPTYLVDRLWPRGVKKADLDIDAWFKEVAPSTELRRWFGHDPALWEEFHDRYTRELDTNPDALAPLRAAVDSGDTTLLYDAKDTAHNQAVVIRDWLTRR
ncbi:MAG: DUF488 domain-containing protein [Nocardioidaceae bacterium]